MVEARVVHTYATCLSKAPMARADLGMPRSSCLTSPRKGLCRRGPDAPTYD